MIIEDVTLRCSRTILNKKVRNSYSCKVVLHDENVRSPSAGVFTLVLVYGDVIMTGVGLALETKAIVLSSRLSSRLCQCSILAIHPGVLFVWSQFMYSKQPKLGLTQESLRMVTARVVVVISGSFPDLRGIHSPQC